MVYFLDASDQLWYFCGTEMTSICKIDRIVRVYSTDYINVKINGLLYVVCEDELSIIHDQSQADQDFGQLISTEGNYVGCSQCIVEDGKYTIKLCGTESEYDVVCKTDIDSSEYAIYHIKVKHTSNLSKDGTNTKILILFVKKSGRTPDIFIMTKCISYTESIDQQDDIHRTDMVTEYTRERYFPIQANGYTYVANEYIKTDKGQIISLINNSKYDSIYPGIFGSIVSRDGEYYISGTCVQLDGFDFGYNAKSARKV